MENSVPDPESTAADRRDGERLQARDDIEIEISERLLPCHLKDLSIGGAGIEADDSIELRENDEVVLWVEDWEPIRARVARITKAGIGLKFVSE